MNKVAFLTAGGLAPCLCASIGALIKNYYYIARDTKLIGYLNGYQGLLQGNVWEIAPSVQEHAEALFGYGGSPLGNSRVSLTNVENCVNRGLVKEGQNPLEVAANQLASDGVNILHTIGGDDTNSMAAELSNYLRQNGYDLTVVGLPKTVDNDVYPIAQTLGAWTAAEMGANFFLNISHENTTSVRQLIIHEVMGRHCGWLTAATTEVYREKLMQRHFVPEMLLTMERWDIDGVYVPEMKIDIEEEVERLQERMEKNDSVHVFVSEGAGLDAIIANYEAEGKEIPRDPFGHVKLDEIKAGEWLGKHFKRELGAEKVLVQKSGYFARSAAPNPMDLDLIKRTAAVAAKCGLQRESGVVGIDEEKNNELCLIEFNRIRGGKPFDVDQDWFQHLLEEIGQPMGVKTIEKELSGAA